MSRLFRVVINHEEQYSVWPIDHQQKEGGWRDAGFTGSLADAREHILEVWTDMRPLSLRRKLGGKGDDLRYQVVINHEEQYSIHLPEQREPDLREAGWRDTKISGGLDRCRDWIEEVWTDMRPLSLRG